MLSVEGRRVRVHLLSVVTALAFPVAVVAGEGDYEGADDHDHGPSFLVEAKRIGSMAPMPDVRVRAQVKGTQGNVVDTTDQDGRAQLRGFGDDVDSDNVIVTCTKSGFKLVEVMRRKLSSAKGAAVEVECLMEPG